MILVVRGALRKAAPPLIHQPQRLQWRVAGGAYSTFWQPISLRASTNDGRSSFFTRIITLCTRPTGSTAPVAVSQGEISLR